jgi:hypothetical protein
VTSRRSRGRYQRQPGRASQQSADKRSGYVQPQDHPGHFMITAVWKYDVLELFIKFPHIYLFTCGLFDGVFTVGFEVLTAVIMKSFIFWTITPCSPAETKRRLGGTCRLYLQGRRVCLAGNQHEADSKQLCLAYPSTPKMKVICSSEKSVDFHRTTQRCFAEDRTLDVLISSD